MSGSTFSHDITLQAGRFGVDARLVEAIVVVESGGHPFATKPERHYRWLWDVKQQAPFRTLTAEEVARPFAPDDFPTLAGHRDQEWQGQRTSWGLMQIMGAVAREHGYRHPYLAELVRVEANLHLGTKHFAALLRRAQGTEAVALAAYNAGWGGIESDAGIHYAGKVLRVREQLITERRSR